MCALRLERFECRPDGQENRQSFVIKYNPAAGYGIGSTYLSIPNPHSLTSENVLVVVYQDHAVVLAGEGVSIREQDDQRIIPPGTPFTPGSTWVATGRDPQRVRVNIVWVEDGKGQLD